MPVAYLEIRQGRIPLRQSRRSIAPGWAPDLVSMITISGASRRGHSASLVLTVLSVALGMFPSLLTGLLSPILTALL